MTATRFRLGAVLRVRRHEFERAAAELAKAERAKLTARLAMDHAKRGADRSRTEIQERLRAGIPAHTLRFIEAGLSRSCDDLIRAKEEVSLANEAVAAARAQLIEARKKVRALQKLEAQHRGRLKQAEERREQASLDEVGQRRRQLHLVALVLAFLVGLGSPVPSWSEAKKAASEKGAAEDYGVTGLLTEIRSRQTELDRRERELDDRERSIADLESAAAKRIEELEEIATTVEERIGAWEADNGNSVRKLAKIYAAMQPALAADLLEELEVGLATQIVAKMKDKQSAAVLSQISEARALSMSRRVAHPLSMEPGTPGSKER